MPGKFSEQNKRQYMRRIALGLCRACGIEKPEPGKKLGKACLKAKLENYYNNREHQLTMQRRYADKLRTLVFDAYGGPECACCGETRREFLQLDHMNGDGAAHRRAIKNGSTTTVMLRWLLKRGFPPGFRVLCSNCNFSIGIRGYCPHEKEREMEKLGVQENTGGKTQEQLEKEAGAGCPMCGGK